ncbi:MAG: tRNA pseudouridine(38-40) synthase TruA [Acidimicrobiales bacterium]
MGEPDLPSAPGGQPVRRWRLVVAYDGSGFRGFAAQVGAAVPTVAGALAEAIARTARLDGPPPIVCAGRTDAGVHALGQVVHVDLPDTFGRDLAHAVNRQLAPAVVVRSAEPAPPGFDARRAARARHYRYLVWNAPSPHPLLAAATWHVAAPLDLRSMAAAADVLIGEHDFRSFCRRAPGTAASQLIVRRVTEARWSGAADPDMEGGRVLRFDVSAGSFCHQMVRSIVGALVEAGRGRANAATVVALLASGSRAGAPRPAPPQGLCLVSVTY